MITETDAKWIAAGVVVREAILEEVASAFKVNTRAYNNLLWHRLTAAGVL